MYNPYDMRFPGFDHIKEEPKRTLSKVELNILAQILNSIRNENFNETMTKITYHDKQSVELYGLIDKINELNKKFDTNK